jgi:hypothetical protein
MDHQDLAVVPLEQEVLPVAPGGHQGAAFEGGEQFGWVPAHRAPARDRQTLEIAAHI